MTRIRTILKAMALLACSAQWAYSYAIPLDLALGELDQVKVKVFPHLRHYKPHGYDQIRTRVKVSSSSDCLLRSGKLLSVGGEGPALMAAREFHIDVSQLVRPLWIACPHGATLHREGHKTRSFTYEGGLYFRPVTNKGAPELQVINLVSLKQYLRGVVPAEVYTGWPLEALKSQAVAARTYAVYHISKARLQDGHRFYDVDDTIQTQAYTGLSQINDRTDQAISATAGEILTHKGQVIQAYYHADSGGHIESASHVWNTFVPYCKGKLEPHLEPKEWTFQIPIPKLKNRFEQAYRTIDSDLVNLEIPDDYTTPAGRVKNIDLLFTNGERRRIGLYHFKKTLGLQLPSSLFRIQWNPSVQTLVITGKGSGHGVGMSQYGAASLAKKKGWDYEKILRYYYSGTSLCTVEKAQEGSCSSKSKVANNT